MIKQIAISILALLSVTLNVAGQDSIPQQRFVPFAQNDKGRWISVSAIGVGAVATGAVSRWAMNDRMIPSRFTKEPGTGVVDVVQYLPLALPWAMKAIGVPTRSGWGRMAMSQGLSVLAMAGTVEMIKRNSNHLRPDGSDLRSFPSGHSAWAFLGATMLSKELGWRSPLYTLGAYTVATGVAMQRVIDRRHLPSDVVAGAGIGILAAQAGYYIGDVIFGNKQLEHQAKGELPSTENNPYLSLETSMIFPIGSISIGNTVIKQGMGLSTGLKGSVPFDNHWGISMQLALRSTPVFIENNDIDIYVAPLNSISAEIAPSYRLPISRHFALTAELAGGYYRNFTLKSVDSAIETNTGNAMGRLNIGARWNIAEDMFLGASMGYEISSYKFSTIPSETYNTSSTLTKTGTTNSLLLNISTSITL